MGILTTQKSVSRFNAGSAACNDLYWHGEGPPADVIWRPHLLMKSSSHYALGGDVIRRWGLQETSAGGNIRKTSEKEQREKTQTKEYKILER